MPPRRRRKAGLHARLVEERLPIPPPLDGNLGEQQTPHPPLRDHQPVPADLDLFGPDGEQRGQDGDLYAQGREFHRGDGREARILGGRGHRAFLDHLVERRHRLGVPDAAAQPTFLREGDESGSRGGQFPLRLFPGRNLPRADVPFQRPAGDPKQAFPLRFVQVRRGSRPDRLRHGPPPGFQPGCGRYSAGIASSNPSGKVTSPGMTIFDWQARKAGTMSGSNWVPEQRRISAMASATGSAFL